MALRRPSAESIVRLVELTRGSGGHRCLVAVLVDGHSAQLGEDLQVLLRPRIVQHVLLELEERQQLVTVHVVLHARTHAPSVRQLASESGRESGSECVSVRTLAKASRA